TAAQVQSDMATPVGSAADTQAPTAPSGLGASAIGSGRVDLSWTAASDNVGVTGYRVESCQVAGCSSFAPIAAATGVGTSFMDSTASHSPTFRYLPTRRSSDLTAGQVQSDMAAPVGSAADTQAPTAPSGLGASAIGSGRVDLSWTAASDNVGVTG